VVWQDLHGPNSQFTVCEVSVSCAQPQLSAARGKSPTETPSDSLRATGVSLLTTKVNKHAGVEYVTTTSLKLLRAIGPN
jgi:hypothetical protein